MHRIKIQVKEKHIEDGSPENCTYCAVALAINEKLSGMFRLDFEPRIVERGNINYALRLSDSKPSPYQTEFEGAEISIAHQELVNNFVDDFDCGRSVSPIEFDLTISDYALKQMKSLEKKERTILDVKNKK